MLELAFEFLVLAILMYRALTLDTPYAYLWDVPACWVLDLTDRITDCVRERWQSHAGRRKAGRCLVCG